MIDSDEEQARMEAMLARRERMALGVTCTEMIELITRLRQAEKDAARWNYVINNHCIGDMNMGLYADYNYGMDVVTKDDAIAIVDEAMQCNK